jgi:C1A family cysteine protease
MNAEREKNQKPCIVKEDYFMIIKKIQILSLSLVLILITGCNNILDNNDGIEPDSGTDIGMPESTPNPEPGTEPEPTTEMEEYPEGDLGKPDDYFSTMLHDTSASLKTSVSYPSSFNYLSQGKVTTAKHQALCGSCWAFAAVGAYESKLLINFNEEYDLSEQQQVSCNTSMSGCDGGYMSCIKYWYDIGPYKESCAHYKAREIPCDNISDCTELDFRVTNYYTVNTNNIEGMKASLYNDGPGYFRFNVYPDFYVYWYLGLPNTVYKKVIHSNINPSGHAVLIIGWNDKKGAWLCKNSWGKFGGPNKNGTFWIAYSGHSNDLEFAMANFNVLRTPCNTTLEWKECNADEYGIPQYTWHNLPNSIGEINTIRTTPGWQEGGSYCPGTCPIWEFVRWRVTGSLSSIIIEDPESPVTSVRVINCGNATIEPEYKKIYSGCHTLTWKEVIPDGYGIPQEKCHEMSMDVGESFVMRTASSWMEGGSYCPTICPYHVFIRWIVKTGSYSSLRISDLYSASTTVTILDCGNVTIEPEYIKVAPYTFKWKEYVPNEYGAEEKWHETSCNGTTNYSIRTISGWREGGNYCPGICPVYNFVYWRLIFGDGLGLKINNPDSISTTVNIPHCGSIIIIPIYTRN